MSRALVGCIPMETSCNCMTFLATVVKPLFDDGRSDGIIEEITSHLVVMVFGDEMDLQTCGVSRRLSTNARWSTFWPEHPSRITVSPIMLPGMFSLYESSLIIYGLLIIKNIRQVTVTSKCPQAPAVVWPFCWVGQPWKVSHFYSTVVRNYVCLRQNGVSAGSLISHCWFCHHLSSHTTVPSRSAVLTLMKLFCGG